jgi:FAD synthetase
MKSKIIPYQLLHPCKQRFPLKPSVLVGGCFDILHFGHLSFLKAAKNHGKYLVVALESDESILTSKKTSPVHTQSQRAEVLAELTCVDAVLLLPLLKAFEDYLALVQYVQPSVIAVTQGDPQMVNKQTQAHLVNAEIKIVNPLIPGLSSRLIRQRNDADLFKIGS